MMSPTRVIAGEALEHEADTPVRLKMSVKANTIARASTVITAASLNTTHASLNAAHGNHGSLNNYMEINSCDEAISRLYNFLSENLDDIMQDPVVLGAFESMSADAVDHGQDVSQLKDVLFQHGFSGVQYKLSSLDVESLHQMLGTLYLARVLQPKMLLEDTHDLDVSANPDVFLQQDSLVKSFVPNALLHIIASDMQEGLYSIKTRRVKVYGACVLADISGFTKMSAKHCQNGSRGLDKLHQATNGFLGRLVKLVYSYGGDVISFAGDALVCTFVNEEQFFDEGAQEEDRAPDATLMKECCLRAMQCALELKEAHTSDLTAHVAVSCGRMSFATLGGVNNEWCCLLTGPCIADLSQCIDDAASRELVVSPQCYSAVRDHLQHGELLDVHPLPASSNVKVLSIVSPTNYMQKQNRITQIESSPELIDLAKRFVPHPAQYAIGSGSFDHINELREVTTMFFKLDSYNSEVHENPTSLQPFFVMAQEALEVSGGFMRQFLVDDKGCVLIGMWGVPSFSHPNNSTRALHCAGTLMQGLAAIKHRGSIGITTGSIYCGSVGSVLRRDYVGIGDKVNLAARLMGKAKGYIFVDEASYKQLSTEAKTALVKSPNGLALKGIVEPIFPYMNGDFDVSKFVLLDKQGDNGDMHIDPAITQVLMDQLDKISVSVARGMEQTERENMSRKGAMKLLGAPKQLNEPNITVLRGMPGMGKKTSAFHFLKSAKERYLRTVYISLRQGDENKSFGVLRKFLLALLDSPDFSNELEQRATLEKCLCKVYDENVRKENALLVLKTVMDCKWSSDGPFYTHDHSNLNGDQTIREVLLYILKQRTTAMVIENAQFCDELSWNEIALCMSMPAKLAALFTLCSLQSSSLLDAKSRKMNRSSIVSMQVQKSFEGLVRSTDLFHAISSLPNCIVVNLPPLNQDDVSRILTYVLQTKVDDSIVKLVLDSSSGNPFWCNMIASYIKDSGLESFSEANKSNSHNPLSVVCICRFEKLSADQQVVARYASVIGNEFPLATLLCILPPRFQQNLDKCLATLSEHGFIFCLSQSPPLYAFQNILIRRFLYDLTPFSDVTKIHESIGNYIETEHADDLRLYYSVLSHHYILSDSSSRVAFKYTVKAADQAICRGAFSDGLEFVQSASKLETSVADLTILVQVIERALKDMRPTGFSLTKAFTSRKGSVSIPSPAAPANTSEQYTAIKLVVESNIQRLIAGGGERYLDSSQKQEASFLNDSDGNRTNKPPVSLLAAWEPSYTAGKTVKLTAAKTSYACILS